MKVGEQFEADYQKNNPMNQPIQENKEEYKFPSEESKPGQIRMVTDDKGTVAWVCTNCRKGDCEDNCHVPQNTSREEIRERWNTSYLRSESRAEKDSQNFWDAIAVFWFAEIEAAEARGRQQNRDAFTNRWIEDAEKKGYSAGQEAERERVQEELEGLRQERDELRDELYKIHH